MLWGRLLWVICWPPANAKHQPSKESFNLSYLLRGQQKCYRFSTVLLQETANPKIGLSLRGDCLFPIICRAIIINLSSGPLLEKLMSGELTPAHSSLSRMGPTSDLTKFSFCGIIKRSGKNRAIGQFFLTGSVQSKMLGQTQY